MALIDSKNVTLSDSVPYGLGFSAPSDIKPEESEPDYMSVLRAQFRTENVLGAAIQRSKVSVKSTEEEMMDYVSGKWNWEDQAQSTRFAGDQEALDFLSTTTNQRSFDNAVEYLDKYYSDRELIANSGTGVQLTSGMIAGLLDPVQLPLYAVPAVKAATMVGKVAYTAGGGFAGSSISEVGLHSMQPLRTKEESVANVGLSTVFGMGLGYTAHGIERVFARGAIPKDQPVPEQFLRDIKDNLESAPLVDSAGSASRIDEQFSDPEFVLDLEKQVEVGKLTSMEAAGKLRDHQLEWTSLKNPGVVRALSYTSPQVRVATSPFTSARVINEQLTEGSFIRTKNQFGVTAGPSVESLSTGKRDVDLSKTYDIVAENWREVNSIKKAPFSTTFGNMKAKSSDNMISLEDFSVEVGRAILKGTHDDPIVLKTAQRIKTEIYEPFEKELLDTGLIGTNRSFLKGTDEVLTVKTNPKTGQDVYFKGTDEIDGSEVEIRTIAEVPEGDANHYPRIWNFDAIRSNTADFTEAVISSIERKERSLWDEATEELEFKLKEDLDEIRAAIPDMINNIISTPTGYVPKDLVFKGSHLMERTLKIPSEDIQDFLIQDVRYVTHAYMDSMRPRLELAKRFDGDFTMEGAFYQVQKEFNDLSKKLKDGKEKAKLAKQYDAVVKDLAAQRDILLRNFKRPDDPANFFNVSGRRLRQWNYVTKLGGMTAAAIPDMANIIMRNGFGNWAKQLTNFVTSPKKFSMTAAQARQAGAALDYQLQGRAEAMMMIDDTYGHVSKLETSIDKGVRTFGNMTGMNHWNTFWKGVASGAFMDDVGRVVDGTKKINKGTRTWLASHGIDRNMINSISIEWKKHGTLESGLRVPNTEKWTNIDAKNAMEAAILQEANTSIVTPGAGDLPLVSRTAVGKLWLQFQTFPLAATNRILVPLAQDFGFRQAAGMISMVSLGMLSYALKEHARGAEPSTDVSTLVREGIDRSGLLGIWGNFNAITEKLTAGQVGLQKLMGGEPISKYRSRSVVNDLMGPSMGTLKDSVRTTNAVFNAIAGEEIDQGDIKAARRLVPFNNLIYIRRFFDEAVKQ